LPQRNEAKTNLSRSNAWTKADIRRARQITLKPVLEKLGYRLDPAKNGNYAVLDITPEIVIKDHYWVCAETGSAGNSIDFLVKIRGASFSDAMALLLSAVSLSNPS
jgi:hypothetical protein